MIPFARQPSELRREGEEEFGKKWRKKRGKEKGRAREEHLPSSLTFSPSPPSRSQESERESRKEAVFEGAAAAKKNIQSEKLWEKAIKSTKKSPDCELRILSHFRTPPCPLGP